MKKPEKKATLKDVAREAGLSVMTVSYVLNGKKLNHASEESRRRILDAARKLNYRPNLHARRLVTPKNNIIGLLIDSQAPAFYKDVMFELEKLAFVNDFRLQIGMMHESLDSIRHYIDDFLGSGVNNVICLSHNYPDFGAQIPVLFESFGHVVFLEEPQGPTHFPVVAADHYSNYFNAVSELLKRGRRRIFSCRRHYHDCAFSESKRGFLAAYQTAGIPGAEHFWRIMETSIWHNHETAEHELNKLLPEKPDALIIHEDESLFWALRVLKRSGIRVPEDIALFSANLSNYGKAATPGFSGFDYNSSEMGHRLMKHLLNSFEQQNPPSPPPRELIPATILWQESC
jgi:DNA-binding LacI/PurR family transcriptional regulator